MAVARGWKVVSPHVALRRAEDAKVEGYATVLRRLKRQEAGAGEPAGDAWMENKPRAPHVVFLKLEGHPVIVVGGGRVAERKVRSLLDCGALVTVVSPEVTPALGEMAAANRIRWERRPYRAGDLEGMRVAYVTAGMRELNEVVRKDALACGALLNVADEPELCDFFTSAVVRQGDLTIAVSTNGASPWLARRIRERLGEEFGPEYGEALVELRRLREEAKAAGRPLREERKRFEAIVSRLMDRG